MLLMLFSVHALNSVAQLDAWLVAGRQGSYVDGYGVRAWDG
jgi:hypothetical protein